ncbi:MAG TPA: GAF and ANTAR domain-containing protein [Methylomirabilota bacterium]|nr:GAF and ANTAR domain-containing protein [Methylomirabilota bacterium]
MCSGANILADESTELDLLHDIASRITAADSLRDALGRVLEFVSWIAKFDSCFIYVLEGNELVLRAARNSHSEVLDRLTLSLDHGISGWVAQHRQPVAVDRNAFDDLRFQSFHQLPEDRCEAFLSVPILSRGKVVGVINVQQREPYVFSHREIRLIATAGFLVGAEIEIARLESVNSRLSEQLNTRKTVERAKGILQRDLQLSEEKAYSTLQSQSRQRRKPMREVAEAIVLSDEIKRSTELV